MKILRKYFVDSSNGKTPTVLIRYNLLWQLTVINDDLLKLWEQTQAENTRLRLELSGVKNENETLKHQLGSAAQQALTLH